MSSKFELELYDENGLRIQMVYMKGLIDEAEKRQAKEVALQNAEETFFIHMVNIIVHNNKTKITEPKVESYLRQYATKLTMNIFNSLKIFHHKFMMKEGERLKKHIEEVVLTQVDQISEDQVKSYPSASLFLCIQFHTWFLPFIHGIASHLGNLYDRYPWSGANEDLAPVHEQLCVDFDFTNPESVSVLKSVLNNVVTLLDAFITHLQE